MKIFKIITFILLSSQLLGSPDTIIGIWDTIGRGGKTGRLHINNDNTIKRERIAKLISLYGGPRFTHTDSGTWSIAGKNGNKIYYKIIFSETEEYIATIEKDGKTSVLEFTGDEYGVSHIKNPKVENLLKEHEKIQREQFLKELKLETININNSEQVGLP